MTVAEDLTAAAVLLMKTATDVSFLAARAGQGEDREIVAGAIRGMEAVLIDVANKLHEAAGKLDLPF